MFSNLCFECLYVMQLNPTALCSWNLFCLQTFTLCLLITEYPKTKFYTEAKRKPPQNILHCWLQWAADTEEASGMRLSSFWRRVLPWLCKAADPTVCFRLEEMSAPCERVKH